MIRGFEGRGGRSVYEAAPRRLTAPLGRSGFEEAEVKEEEPRAEEAEERVEEAPEESNGPDISRSAG